MNIKSTIDGITDISFKASENDPLVVSFNKKESQAKIISNEGNQLTLEKDGRKFYIKVLGVDKEKREVLLKINGDLVNVTQEDEYDALLKSLGMGAGAIKKVNDLKAPMPGVVIDIKVEAGQSVLKDEGIVVLEAMKMENLLKSPIDGVIKSVEIVKGDTVEKNKVLVNFE